MFKSADHALSIYLRTIERCSSPRYGDPYAIRGRERIDKCHACNTIGSWKQQDGVWRCQARNCGAVQAYRPVAIPRAAFQQTKGKPYDPMLDQLVELSIAFAKVDPWGLNCWALLLCSRDVPTALGHARERWPGGPVNEDGTLIGIGPGGTHTGWSRKRFDDLVEAAKTRAERELESRGLL